MPFGVKAVEKHPHIPPLPQPSRPQGTMVTILPNRSAVYWLDNWDEGLGGTAVQFIVGQPLKRLTPGACQARQRPTRVYAGKLNL